MTIRNNTDIRDLRRLYGIRDVLARAGVDVRRKWLVCPLPLHTHSNYTPSFSIYVGSDRVERFKCHGTCGAYGDCIDLAGYLWVTGYDPTNPKDVGRAIDCLRTRNDFVFPTSETPKEPTLDQLVWKNYLPINDEGRQYAHERGLSDETIEHFHLGADNNYLTIPTFHNGILMTLKKRSIRGAELRFICETGSKMALFNHDEVAYTTGAIFYVKAEIPAMLLHQLGYRACAPSTGETSWNPSWKTLLAFADIIVVGDNDEPGVAAAEQRARDLNAQLRYPPPGYDLDSWILAEPIEAISTLEEWIK